MSRHDFSDLYSYYPTIIQQMPENELVRHTPEQLATLCECSTRHFSRLFRKHFGTSVRSRQTELRLLKARQLLLETDAKITSVALSYLRQRSPRFVRQSSGSPPIFSASRT